MPPKDPLYPMPTTYNKASKEPLAAYPLMGVAVAVVVEEEDLEDLEEDPHWLPKSWLYMPLETARHKEHCQVYSMEIDLRPINLSKKSNDTYT